MTAFPQPGQAFLAFGFGQAPDVVLERVGDPSAHHADPAFPVMVKAVVPHEFFYQVIKLRVARKHHMAANIPGEPLVI